MYFLEDMIFQLINIFCAKFYRLNGGFYRHHSDFQPYDFHSRVFINSNFDRINDSIANRNGDDFTLYSRKFKKYEDIDSLDIPSTPKENNSQKKKTGRISNLINLLFKGVKAISPSMIFIHLFSAGVFIFVGYQLRTLEEHGNFVRVPTEQLDK